MTSIILDGHKDTPKRLNQLAREQLKTKLLNDILIDINISKLEGWDMYEYIDELIDELIDLLSTLKDTNI